MKRKPNQWESDATFGSDILGVGSYANLPPSGKPKNTTQIGFIRQAKPIRKQPTVVTKKK